MTGWEGSSTNTSDLADFFPFFFVYVLFGFFRSSSSTLVLQFGVL